MLSKLRRRWDTGEPLATHASGRAWESLTVPIRAPGPSDLGERFDQVRVFVNEWEHAVRSAQMRGHVALEYRAIGGRASGSNRIPSRLLVPSFGCFCALLGVADDARAYTDALAYAKDREPSFASWMLEKPKRALAELAELPSLFDAALWVATQSGSPVFLREIDVPGVDTKFIENHRTAVAELVELKLEAGRFDPTVPLSDFSRRYGLRGKPKYVRFRLLSRDPRFPANLSEITVRTAELSLAPITARRIFIVENESTYLAFPEVPDSALIFGGGYAISTLSHLPWLADRELFYWGDIDTHGFSILNRLRVLHPNVRSILMDRGTLLAYESRWVHEPTQAIAELAALETAESDLYRELIEGTLGPSIRLEQERVSFVTVRSAISGIVDFDAVIALL